MIGKLVANLKKAWNFVSQRRKTILAASFVILAGVAVVGIFGTDVVNAQTTVENASLANGDLLSKEFWIGLVVEILLGLARLCLSITLFILTFIIQLAGYNGYLDSSAVTVGWVMVRDITNMGFVVILLIIAFGTILGLEHYEWKKMLVKLVMAAILVNFSRTICGIFIDIAQVVMTTFVNGIAATAGGNLIRMFNLDSIRDLSTNTTSDPTSFNIINFFLAAVMALVFSAIVMVTMGIFLFMLLARMLVLWVLIVLSPLAFVLSVLPQTESYASEWWHEFGANVVTGPVLLFFVWLAFVTVGNGKINEEIAGASITGSANGVEADQLAGQSSGLGKAMDWNNMASFVIAIGMLVVGSRVASQLGGIGGDWAGQAVDFGKKVGLYASGAMAARWAMEKTGEGAAAAGKFALAKAPLIGGEAMHRYTETAKEYAKNQWIRKVQMPRDQKAIQLEEADRVRKKISEIQKKENLSYQDAFNKLEEKDKRALSDATKGVSGKITSFLGASLIETSKRKDKRLEDIQGANENLEHTWGENLSTSKSWQGQLKLLTGIELHAAERQAEGKRRQKYAEKTMEMMGSHKPEYALFHKMEENADKALAIGENLEGQINRTLEINVAKKRDDELRKLGKTPRFVESVTARHAKEDLELAGSSDFDRTMGKVKSLKEKIKVIRDRQTSGTATPKDQEDLKMMVQDMAALASFNASRGSMFSTVGTAVALDGTPYGHAVDASDVYAQGAVELAAVLQRNVDASKAGIDSALSELQSVMGDKYQAFMQAFVAGLAHSADDGAVNKAGLFRERYDAARGESVFSAPDISDPAEVAWIAGKREYALSQAKASKIEGFAGMVDTNATGKNVVVSDAAKSRIADVFGVVTTNMVNNISRQNIDSFNEAFENMSSRQIQELIDIMRTRAKDEEGIVALLKRTKLNEYGTFDILNKEGTRRIQIT